jgi:hypothetical protein
LCAAPGLDEAFGAARISDAEFEPASVCAHGKFQLHPLSQQVASVACCVEVWTVSADKKHSNQNWHGPGESDCLIKTKHCDGHGNGVDAM